MNPKKTPLDEQVSDEEYQSKEIHYLNSELQVELEFNKSIMNLSAGALVLSVTVIQLFLEGGSLIYKNLLWLSWMSLFSSTLFCLFFFKIVHKEIRRKHQKLIYFYKTEPPERYDELIKKISRENIEQSLGIGKWNKKLQNAIYKFISFHVKHFSKITSFLFMIGVCFLIVFTYLNL